jgi:hypothetical protein
MRQFLSFIVLKHLKLPQWELFITLFQRTLIMTSIPSQPKFGGLFVSAPLSTELPNVPIEVSLARNAGTLTPDAHVSKIRSATHPNTEVILLNIPDTFDKAFQKTGMLDTFKRIATAQ